MDLARLKADYDRDGFVVVRNFLPQDLLDELRGQLDRYTREVVPTLPDWQAFYDDRSRPETLKQLQHMTVDPFFRDYAGHERWTALACALVGDEAKCEGPEWFNKPPGTNHPTPPHQDNYYFNLAPPDVVTIWTALDPVDDENGCLRYVRGSHRRGFRPHARSKVLGFSQGISDYSPADESQEERIHLAPGDATAHHGMTIHRADPNQSAIRNRRAFAMVFKGVGCRRDEEGFARYQAAYRQQHADMGLQTQ